MTYKSWKSFAMLHSNEQEEAKRFSSDNTSWCFFMIKGDSKAVSHKCLLSNLFLLLLLLLFLFSLLYDASGN